MERSVFVKHISKEMREGNVAIFAGAGMSMSCGYVSWKELLRDIAVDLSLDIDEEHDLVAVAQFHINKNGFNRSAINQQILDKFTENVSETPLHNTLSRLPIDNFWTTNYDTIIEDSLKKNNKKVDVKHSTKQLSVNVSRRDATVYKMHGDVSHSYDAVISKDDYETYNEKRQLFSTALQGDLISKTFIFIGFSFEDPNLNYILSRIRILLGENQRQHFALFKRPSITDFDNNVDEFNYAKIKQDHCLDDLKRYAITPVLVDRYDDIPEIFSTIEKKLQLKNVFISGSAVEYGNVWDKRYATLINEIVQNFIDKDYKVYSGFGLGIGSHIINYSVQYIDQKKHGHYDEYLKISPFPFQLEGEEREKFNHKYRESLIDQCGVCLFLFGNKRGEDGRTIVADGVMQEFKIAAQQNRYIIPLGATGYAAKEICDIVQHSLNVGEQKYSYLSGHINHLVNSCDANELIRTINIVLSIIDGD